MIVFHILILLIFGAILDKTAINANNIKLDLNKNQIKYKKTEKDIDKENPFSNDIIHFNVIGETSHLFKEEDFKKVKANLHYNNNYNQDEQVDEASRILINEKNNNLNMSNNKFEKIEGSKQSIKCNLKNSTIQKFLSVKLINGSSLSNLLSNSEKNDCFVVMFYLPWCPFCAKLAPHYNALPRFFPKLDVVAIDASKSGGFNTKFGTSAVPMVLIFHHLNIIAKYNHTEKNFTDLMNFVSKHTGIEENKKANVSADDFIGPVPTISGEKYDYFLLFSWINVIFFTLKILISKSNYILKRIINHLGKTTNAIRHLHQD